MFLAKCLRRINNFSNEHGKCFSQINDNSLKTGAKIVAILNHVFYSKLLLFEITCQDWNISPAF